LFHIDAGVRSTTVVPGMEFHYGRSIHNVTRVLLLCLSFSLLIQMPNYLTFHNIFIAKYIIVSELLFLGETKMQQESGVGAGAG
jgi:hypothetical protein